MRTNVGHIYAIGDVIGQPMLAHKATHEGIGRRRGRSPDEDVAFDARSIPSVAYTDPEIAWTGLTETEARGDRSYEGGEVPVGGLAAGRWRSAAPRADQAPGRSRRPDASSAPASSAPTPAS